LRVTFRTDDIINHFYLVSSRHLFPMVPNLSSV
jgi:hypothetical protein